MSACAAIAALLLANSGGGDQEAERQHNDAGSHHGKGATLTAPPITEHIAAPDQKHASREGEAKSRGDELQADWKAADAAADAAKYALWSAWIAMAGTVMLVLTFWEQRKVGRAQVRAYLDVKEMRFEVAPDPPGGWKGVLDIEIGNFGETPAFNVLVEARWMRPTKPDVTVVDESRPPDPIGGISRGDTYSLRRVFKFAPDDPRRFAAGERVLWCDVRIDYKDTFGRKRFTSLTIDINNALNDVFIMDGSHKMT